MSKADIKLTYVLILYLAQNTRIRVGSLGLITFRPGLYFYVGSGGRSPFKRLRRHLRRRKKKFWHIDFLTLHSRVIGAVIIEKEASVECTLARRLSEAFTPVRRFGSSDCRCPSHLFYAGLESLRR